MNRNRHIARRLDLQRFATVTQTTLLPALSDDIKTYYEKRLLDNAEPKLVHNQFGDKYPIPKRGGKSIEFRKYDPLPKATTPLTEGVTPDGNNLNITAITAVVDQYGDWIQLSDMLDLAAIDNNVLQATKLLGSQAGRTLDTLTRDVLCGGTNVLYAPKLTRSADNTVTAVTPVSSRYALDKDCVLSPDLIFQAAALLGAQNADFIDDGYVAIIHPYTKYDLMRSKEWIDVHKYATPDNYYRGEVGKIGNVRFVESSEAKIIKAAALPKEGLKVASYASKVITLNGGLTSDEAAAFAGRFIIVDGVQYEVASAAAHQSAGTITVKDDAQAGANTPAANDVIYAGESGAAGVAVFCTLVLGAHAYGLTDIEGGGLKHIVKQLGYGDDPLDQRSSTGWKATHVAKRLCEQFMVRIESGSAYSDKAAAN